MEIWKRAKARDEAVETDDVGKPVRLCDKRCVANWDGHCAVEKCAEPIFALDIKPVVSETRAAELYALFKEMIDLEFERSGESK